MELENRQLTTISKDRFRLKSALPSEKNHSVFAQPQSVPQDVYELQGEDKDPGVPFLAIYPEAGREALRDAYPVCEIFKTEAAQVPINR